MVMCGESMVWTRLLYMHLDNHLMAVHDCSTLIGGFLIAQLHVGMKKRLRLNVSVQEQFCY